eukprot:2558065-Rhodomonas_salina.1
MSATSETDKNFPRNDGLRSNYKSWRTNVALIVTDVLKYGFVYTTPASPARTTSSRSTKLPH